MAKPKVIGFFTENTPYEHEAETLKVSLEQLGYEYFFKGVENFGSWQKNTQYKARFIKDMLLKYPGERLLYLDVDAIMVHPPELLDTIDCDIAAVHFADSNELLSGTVFFSGSEACMKVVDAWIRINLQYPDRLPNRMPAWDQRTLEMAIKETEDCRFLELPQEYTWIVELTQRHLPNLSPVIMHTRGAKRFKNLINGKDGYAK